MSRCFSGAAGYFGSLEAHETRARLERAGSTGGGCHSGRVHAHIILLYTAVVVISRLVDGEYAERWMACGVCVVYAAKCCNSDTVYGRDMFDGSCRVVSLTCTLPHISRRPDNPPGPCDGDDDAMCRRRQNPQTQRRGT